MTRVLDSEIGPNGLPTYWSHDLAVRAQTTKGC
jgi:hypothetical protein